MDEVDTSSPSAGRIPLGFGVPDLLDLQQPAVATAHVVLPEVECRTPTRAFEFATILLLEDRTVLALAKQPLAWLSEGLGRPWGHLEPPALWNVSADWV